MNRASMTFCQTYRSDGIKHRLEPSGREMNEHDHPVETILHESTKKNEIRTNRILTEQRVVCTKQSRAQRTAEKVISKPFRRPSTMEKCKSHQSDLIHRTPFHPIHIRASIVRPFLNSPVQTVHSTIASAPHARTRVSTQNTPTSAASTFLPARRART